VPTSDVSYPFVENIYHNQVTIGCAPGLFCPKRFHARWQMAVFLSRRASAPAWRSPSPARWAALLQLHPRRTSLFAASFHRRRLPRVHYIYSRQVTVGCAPGIFCPTTSRPAGRWRSSFPASCSAPAWRSPSPHGRQLSLQLHPAAPPSSPTSFHRRRLPGVHYIYSKAITTGCAPGAFCPDVPTPRWQMAVFLVRTFQLTLFSDAPGARPKKGRARCPRPPEGLREESRSEAPGTGVYGRYGMPSTRTRKTAICAG